MENLEIQPPGPSDPIASPPPPKPSLFLPIFLTFLLTSALIVGGYYGYQNFKSNPNPGSDGPTCTMEAKLCPDGTSVGRTSPNCEFAPCPTPDSSTNSDWKIYQNPRYGYQLKYPQDLILTETDGPSDSQLAPNQKIQEVTFSNESLVLKIYYEGGFDHGFEPWELDKRENLTLGDKPAIKTTLTSLESDHLWIIYTIENFHSFRIEASIDQSDIETTDHILSTLTFD